MTQARIQHHFFETADLLNQVADILSRPVADACQTIVGCLTSGGRVLACGQGADAALARGFCSALLHGFERPRPSLAALALGPELSAPLAQPAGMAELLSAQIRTFGQPGDVLLLLAGTERTDDALLQAAVAAHEQEMSVVLLTGGDPGPWPDALAETDVWIPVANPRPARVREIHLLALHALCDAIDLQLLGDIDASPRAN